MLPTYEIYCVKYAERPGRRPAHFVGGDPHDAPMPMDYYVWLVRNQDRMILVDTGFDASMAINGRAPSTIAPTRAFTCRTRKCSM